MKKYFFAIAALMASVAAFAQVDSTTVDTTAMTSPSDTVSEAAGSTTPGDTAAVAAGDTATINDEDLKKYAIVMDSVEGMKQSLLSDISAKIKSNKNLKVSRYNQLSKAIDDEAKLQELKATPEEIAFVKEVAELKNQGAKNISDQVELMANDFVGVEKYNKIKESLATDTELKARYDTIFAEVQSEDATTAKGTK